MIVCNTRNLYSKTTGVQRYTQEITSALANKITCIQPHQKSSGVKGHLWEQFKLPRLVGQNILWSPANVGPLCVENQILTVHDIAVIDHPEWFSKKFHCWYAWLWKRLLKKVKGIITISHFSKARIMQQFDVPEEKICVVYNGVKRAVHHVAPTSNTFQKIENPYVLSVCSLEPRKNLDRLTQAWKYFHSVFPNYSLVLVGDRNALFNKVALNKDQSIITTGWLSDAELSSIYESAEFFIYPSLYEGFGLPIFEAMSHCLPVITSNITAIPEVVKDAAMLVDPYSIEELGASMVELAKNSALRNTLIEKGVERVKCYSWEKTAIDTLDAIVELSSRA